MPILGIMASAMSANLFQPAGAYDSLATVTVPSGGVASVTFAGIPNTYKHLQIRGIAKVAGGSSGYSGGLVLTLNNDTGANYAYHELYGTGSAAGAYGIASQTGDSVLTGSAQFAAHIFDILDYSNTSKNTTIRHFMGTDTNGSGIVALESGLWMNTAAVSTIKFSLTTIAEYSQFSLYGVR